jgi:hypothetical protein
VSTFTPLGTFRRVVHPIRLLHLRRIRRSRSRHNLALCRRDQAVSPPLPSWNICRTGQG